MVQELQNHNQNFRRQLVGSKVTLHEIFKEATISREKQCGSALEKKAGIKHRCTAAAVQAVRNASPCPKWFLGGWPTPTALHPKSIQVYLRKGMTCSASPLLRCPAVPQRQRTGRNVDLNTASTASQQTMEQMETVSTLSFPKRIMSAGPGWRLHQSPVPATTAASPTLLSEAFIKTSVPCCSHGGLHVLPKYPASTSKVFADIEISSSPFAPAPKNLGPQHKSPPCWEIFITQGWARGLKLKGYYQRGKDLTTVHGVCSSDPAISQLRVHINPAEHSNNPLLLMHCLCWGATKGVPALGQLWVLCSDCRATPQLGLGHPHHLGLPSLLKGYLKPLN